MEIGRRWTDRSLTHFAPASAPLRQGSGRRGVRQGERRSGLFCVHDELANQPKDVISSIGRSWGGGDRGEKSFVGLACAGRPRPMINIPTELLRTFVAGVYDPCVSPAPRMQWRSQHTLNVTVARDLHTTRGSP